MEAEVMWKAEDNLWFSLYHLDSSVWSRSSGFSEVSLLSELSWWPWVISMYFWMKIQILSLSLCILNACFVRIDRTIFFPPYNGKGSMHRKCEAKYKEDLEVIPCKLAPTSHLNETKQKTLQAFLPVLPHAQDQEKCAHFVFYNPFFLLSSHSSSLLKLL